jgi:hypothetical protein
LNSPQIKPQLYISFDFSFRHDKKYNWIENEKLCRFFFFRFHQLNINHWDMNLYIVEAESEWEILLYEKESFFFSFSSFFSGLKLDYYGFSERRMTKRDYWAIQRLGHIFFAAVLRLNGVKLAATWVRHRILSLAKCADEFSYQ